MLTKLVNDVIIKLVTNEMCGSIICQQVDLHNIINKVVNIPTLLPHVYKY